MLYFSVLVPNQIKLYSLNLELDPPNITSLSNINIKDIWATTTVKDNIVLSYTDANNKSGTFLLEWNGIEFQKKIKTNIKSNAIISLSVENKHFIINNKLNIIEVLETKFKDIVQNVPTIENDDKFSYNIIKTKVTDIDGYSYLVSIVPNDSNNIYIVKNFLIKSTLSEDGKLVFEEVEFLLTDKKTKNIKYIYLDDSIFLSVLYKNKTVVHRFDSTTKRFKNTTTFNGLNNIQLFSRYLVSLDVNLKKLSIYKNDINSPHLEYNNLISSIILENPPKLISYRLYKESEDVYMVLVAETYISILKWIPSLERFELLKNYEPTAKVRNFKLFSI